MFEAPAAPAGPTPWARTIRVVVGGEVKQSTEKLRIKDCVVETDAGIAETLRASEPPVQDLLPGASLPMEIRGAFQRPGTYKGELVLVQEARVRVVPIRITIGAPPAPVAPTPLPIQSHGGGAVLLTDGDRTTWQLELRNTGLARLDIDLLVAAIARVDKASNPTYRLKIPLGDIKATATPLDPGALGRAEIGGESLEHAIDEPGIYEVEVLLRDAAGRHTPSSVTTIVYRRRPWWCAVSAIALGALVAAIVRWFLEGGEWRIRLRDQIQLLLQRIRIARDAARGDAVSAAARELEVAVEDQRRQLRWFPEPVRKQKEVIDRAEARLMLLLESQDAAARIERLEPARQGALRKRLDEVLAAVRVDLGDEAIKKQREVVAQLGVDAVWREQLADWLGELDKQYAFQLPGASARLEMVLGELGGSIEEARRALSADRLDEAHRALEALQLRLEEAVAAELEELAAAEEPPLGVSVEAFQAVASGIRAQLAVVRDVRASRTVRKEAFRSAQRRYIELVVNGLADEAERRAAAYLPATARLRAIASDLRQALGKDLADVAARYGSLRAEIERIGQSPVRPVPVGTKALDLVAWIPRLFLSRGDVERPLAVASPRVPPSNRVANTMRWAVNAVVFALAVASGFRVLWVGDLSWGTWGAMLTAFLWGAGVQTAGNALSEVTSLRDKLTGSRTP
ncbi:MAG TPA: hypothetical protein VNO30_27155 [Kofleriaceae bacterium]|nr:hypothetical protein [Kofleriaceae bacterium]